MESLPPCEIALFFDDNFDSSVFLDETKFIAESSVSVAVNLMSSSLSIDVIPDGFLSNDGLSSRTSDGYSLGLISSVGLIIIDDPRESLLYPKSSPFNLRLDEWAEERPADFQPFSSIAGKFSGKYCSMGRGASPIFDR